MYKITGACYAYTPGQQGTGGDQPRESPDIDVKVPAAGVVRVTPLRNGRYLVEIGRARYVKRFNLSDAEARELYARIGATVPGIAPAVTQ